MLTHVVTPSDTLTKIAKKYGTSVSALVSVNGIKNPDLIYDGQVLKIPSDNAEADLLTLVDKVLTELENLPSFKELCRRMGNKL